MKRHWSVGHSNLIIATSRGEFRDLGYFAHAHAQRRIIYLVPHTATIFNGLAQVVRQLNIRRLLFWTWTPLLVLHGVTLWVVGHRWFLMNNQSLFRRANFHILFQRVQLTSFCSFGFALVDFLDDFHDFWLDWGAFEAAENDFFVLKLDIDRVGEDLFALNQV